MEQVKSLFYVGKKYRPVIEHPKFGKHYIDLSTGEVKLPKEYADILLSVSPKLFKDIPPKGVKVAGVDYESMKWGELLRYAEDRGVNCAGKKKANIINDLLKLDSAVNKPVAE